MFEGLMMCIFMCGLSAYSILQRRIKKMEDNKLNVVLTKNYEVDDDDSEEDTEEADPIAAKAGGEGADKQ